MANLSLHAFGERLLRLRFGAETRRRVYRRLAALLQQGRELPEALRQQYLIETNDGRQPGQPAGQALARWRAILVSGGAPFHRAVGDWIPQSERLMIAAGANSGRIADALVLASDVLLAERRIKRAIFAAIAGPSWTLTLVIAQLVIFSIYLFPDLNENLPREQISGSLQLVSAVGDGLKNGWPLIFAFVIAVMGLIGFSMSRWTGPLRLRTERIPPWSIYKRLTGARVLFALSAMRKAGAEWPIAIRLLLQESFGNPWLIERLRPVLRRIEGGADIGEAFEQAGHGFPDPVVLRDLRSAAGAGRFGETIELIAREHMDSTIEGIERMSGIMTNALALLASLMVAFIAVAITTLQSQGIGG